eukprot:scaffold215375_cov37-Tisochrysis_lutea.AAC.2
MAQFRTGEELRCPAQLHVPIDDDTKFSVSDYRDKLYKDVVARRKDRTARMAAYFPRASHARVAPPVLDLGAAFALRLVTAPLCGGELRLQPARRGHRAVCLYDGD